MTKECMGSRRKVQVDCCPRGGTVLMLDLLRPIYRETAAYGHFGRTGDNFTWERTDRAEVLREDAGI